MLVFLQSQGQNIWYGAEMILPRTRISFPKKFTQYNVTIINSHRPIFLVVNTAVYIVDGECMTELHDPDDPTAV